jgi:SAM-dependent methyltransferase
LIKLQAEKIKSDLEDVDANLYQKLRASIMTGRYKGEAFRKLVSEYVDWRSDNPEHQAMPGYDNLDILINGLFPFEIMPKQTLDLEPEMVYFQKTPARIIFELVEKVQLNKDDVFYDLGSGLGQVVMLVNLLTGIVSKGIEFEPIFCQHARHCARELNLCNVQFTNADARQADYSDGTLFFMFTPFTGAIMQEVLERLKQESLTRKIRIITYGYVLPGFLYKHG